MKRNFHINVNPLIMQILNVFESVTKVGAMCLNLGSILDVYSQNQKGNQFPVKVILVQNKFSLRQTPNMPSVIE